MKLTSNPNHSDRRTSAQTTRTTTRRGARIARLIALSAVVGLFACQDTTAPEATEQANLSDPAMDVVGTTPLETIGTTLIDATSWVLSSIDDSGTRLEMETTLNSLATNLTIGAWDAARVDVTTARAILTSLGAVDAVEIGPIEISLDQTDAELTVIGK